MSHYVRATITPLLGSQIHSANDYYYAVEATMHDVHVKQNVKAVMRLVVLLCNTL
jgi:hypothetical protein